MVERVGVDWLMMHGGEGHRMVVEMVEGRIGTMDCSEGMWMVKGPGVGIRRAWATKMSERRKKGRRRGYIWR